MNTKETEYLRTGMENEETLETDNEVNKLKCLRWIFELNGKETVKLRK